MKTPEQIRAALSGGKTASTAVSRPMVPDDTSKLTPVEQQKLSADYEAYIGHLVTKQGGLSAQEATDLGAAIRDWDADGRRD